MKRLQQVFEQKDKVLNIYCTAGFPELGDTLRLIKALESSGADIVELGMPYSDPLADGATIQQSSAQALQNGMTLPLLFEQLEALRPACSLPVILMGYYNQLLQFGMERFLQKASEAGVDGVILPDLPLAEYERDYKALFEQYDLGISFLLGPHTSEARIREVDRLSRGFVYVLSSSATTGKQQGFSSEQHAYFSRLRGLNLKTPMLIGFGIHNNELFEAACAQAEGAIIGSAFIRAVAKEGKLEQKVQDFVQEIRKGKQAGIS